MQPAVRRRGILVYITIVCSIYFLILRHLCQPRKGLEFAVDTTLHYAIPLLYYLFGLAAVRP